MGHPERAVYPVEMRCPNTLHGILRNGLIEVKCHHIRCTKGRAVNVLHYFDPETGAMVDTKVYQDPTPRLKGHKR